MTSLNKLSLAPQLTNGSLFMKHPNIIEQLGTIKTEADIHGLKISEIKLRENTLEDVFINLTGRRLRQ
jgi:hypothetical protein